MAGSHVKDFSPEPSTHPLPTLLYMRKYLRYLCRCCFHCCCEGHSVGVRGGTSPHYVPTLPQNTQFGACSENFLISLELHSFNGYSLDGWVAGWRDKHAYERRYGAEYAAGRTKHNCSSPSSSELQYYLGGPSSVTGPSPQQLAGLAGRGDWLVSARFVCEEINNDRWPNERTVCEWSHLKVNGIWLEVKKLRNLVSEYAEL